jgi:hypothetical protein
MQCSQGGREFEDGEARTERCVRTARKGQGWVEKHFARGSSSDGVAVSEGPFGNLHACDQLYHACYLPRSF